MVDQTPRAALEAALKPLLPAKWKIIPNGKIRDASNVTTVQLFQGRIKAMELAPVATLIIEFVVEISSAYGADRARAEDDSWENVTTFTNALDSKGILWTEATPFVSQDEQSFGYQVTLSITSSKEA